MRLPEYTNQESQGENKMNNQAELERHYTGLGYNFLGWLNTNGYAQDAYQNSSNKQFHRCGRCIELVACHDLKVYFLIDSSD